VCTVVAELVPVLSGLISAREGFRPYAQELQTAREREAVMEEKVTL
jgi:hypothetical protein